MPHPEPTLLSSIVALLAMIIFVLSAAAARYSRRQGEVLAVLRSHDAQSRISALSPEALGIARDAAYRALVRGGVVVEVTGDRAYLSPIGLAAATRQQARRRGLFWVAAVALPILSMLVASL